MNMYTRVVYVSSPTTGGSCVRTYVTLLVCLSVSAAVVAAVILTLVWTPFLCAGDYDFDYDPPDRRDSKSDYDSRDYKRISRDSKRISRDAERRRRDLDSRKWEHDTKYPKPGVRVGEHGGGASYSGAGAGGYTAPRTGGGDYSTVLKRLAVKDLKEGDEAARLRAVRVLRGSGGDAAVDALISALDDPSALVKKAAIEALAALNDPRAVEPLKKLQKKGDESIATDCVFALEHLCCTEKSKQQ